MALRLDRSGDVSGLGMDWRRREEERRLVSLNASPALRAVSDVRVPVALVCTTSPLDDMSILSKLSWWWSAAMGAGGFRHAVGFGGIPR